MPVNHNLRIIFIHIPKTAGTSIEYALGMHGGLKTIGLERYINQTSDYNCLFGNGLQHLTASQIRKVLGKKIFNDYFKFSVVRNPYDRIVSYIAWLDGKWQNRAQLSIEKFREYIRLSQNRYKNRVKILPRPQYPFIYIRNRRIVNGLLYYEDLEKEIACLQIKLNITLNLERRMESEHLDYRNYYDSYSIRIIRNFYKKDFENFGYDARKI